MELSVIIGLVQAVLTGGVVFYLNKTQRRIDSLDGEVQRLRDEKVKGLETKFDCHLSDDETKKILSELKNLTGSVEKLSDKMDNVREETAGQAARITSNKEYIKNLDFSFQHHKREDHKNGKH